MPSRARISTVAKSLDRFLAVCEAAILSTSILAMAAINIANVAGRNLFDYSLTFTAELNRLLIVIITFAGIGYAARSGRHIRMTALSERVHGLAGRVLETLTLAGTGALLLWLAWLALGYVERTAMAGSVTPALRLPLYLIYAIVPLGLAVGGIRFLLLAAKPLRGDAS